MNQAFSQKGVLGRLLTRNRTPLDAQNFEGKTITSVIT